MSEFLEDNTPSLDPALDAVAESDSDADAGNEAEYEEITSEEVDRIVDALDHLIESVTSENIRFHLEEAAASIYGLVYEEDEITSESSETDSLDQAA